MKTMLDIGIHGVGDGELTKIRQDYKGMGDGGVARIPRCQASEPAGEGHGWENGVQPSVEATQSV
jgi:hypothetical protein